MKILTYLLLAVALSACSIIDDSPIGNPGAEMMVGGVDSVETSGPISIIGTPNGVGYIVFWSNDASLLPIQVDITGSSWQGQVTAPIQSAPACVNPFGGLVFGPIPIGTESYTAYSVPVPSATWSGTVSVTSLSCHVELLN